MNEDDFKRDENCGRKAECEEDNCGVFEASWSFASH
jgi:hypothetical protein